MAHGPGTEYYPRIAQLETVASVVAVSYSTAHDLVALYGDRVKKRPGDPYYRQGGGQDGGQGSQGSQSDQDGDQDQDPDPITRDTIISTTPNRISREVFPGPASAPEMRSVRERYRVWSVDDVDAEVDASAADGSTTTTTTTTTASVTPRPRPVYRDADGVPYDYFLTVGSAHPYKNFGALFSAMDRLPDWVLTRVSFIMVGRGAPTAEERARIQRHPLHVQRNTDPVNKSHFVVERWPASAVFAEQQHQGSTSPAGNSSSTTTTTTTVPPVRVQILDYVDEKDLPALYSSMLCEEERWRRRRRSGRLNVC